LREFIETNLQFKKNSQTNHELQYPVCNMSEWLCNYVYVLCNTLFFRITCDSIIYLFLS
ncbi:unnamed protein product, partial [Arabidopsis halleri]